MRKDDARGFQVDHDLIRSLRDYVPITMPQAIRDVAEHRASQVERILEGTSISNHRLQAKANRLASAIRKEAAKKAKRVETRLANNQI